MTHKKSLVNLVLFAEVTSFESHHLAEKHLPLGMSATPLAEGTISIRDSRLVALLDHFSSAHGYSCCVDRFVVERGKEGKSENSEEAAYLWFL